MVDKITKKQKYLAIFLLFLFHISLLDLFFVTLNGPVFLFEENLRIETILTHLFIAAITTLLCYFIQQLRKAYKLGKLKLQDKAFMLCSAVLLVAIYFVLFKL